MKKGCRYWNHWTTEGWYKGLSDIEKEYLDKFNQEWTGQTFNQEPLHNVKQRQELAHSEHARRCDAMNGRVQLTVTNLAVHTSHPENSVPEIIDSHKLLQQRRKKLIQNEKASKRFLKLEKETPDVGQQTERKTA